MNEDFDQIYGTKEEFITKYGEYTSDGTPRFGDDYSFLIHPNELDGADAKSFFDEVADGGILSIQSKKPITLASLLFGN